MVPVKESAFAIELTPKQSSRVAAALRVFLIVPRTFRYLVGAKHAIGACIAGLAWSPLEVRNVSQDHQETQHKITKVASITVPVLHLYDNRKRVRMEGWRQRRLSLKAKTPVGKTKTTLTVTGLLMEGVTRHGFNL